MVTSYTIINQYLLYSWYLQVLGSIQVISTSHIVTSKIVGWIANSSHVMMKCDPNPVA